MGHAGAPSWPCVGVEQVVRAHHGEARVDDATLALLDLVHGRLHVVVDAAARNATECGEAARVRVEQHLVALARVGHEPEGTAGAQLHVRDLQAVVDAAHEQSLFAPVELEGLAEFEGQRHEGARADEHALLVAPFADEVGQPRVAARVAVGRELDMKNTSRAAFVLDSARVDFERLRQRRLERCELGQNIPPTVLRPRAVRRAKPLLDRVA